VVYVPAISLTLGKLVSDIRIRYHPQTSVWDWQAELGIGGQVPP
jgi:hypothetical protein